ncbi:MAG TPA: DUF6358 family protein [Mucilaginibacter sp.]
MGKKLFLNVLYNIGIFLCLIIGYQYGIEQKQYIYLLPVAAIIAILVVLKVKLLKQVREAQKNLK